MNPARRSLPQTGPRIFFRSLPQPLSNPQAKNDRMRQRYYNDIPRPREQLIAGFGDAQILKDLDGKLEIRGGTEQEKAEARDWMNQFLTPPLLPVS